MEEVRPESAHRLAAGFTLLEVLVAVGVLSILMGAVYGSYRAVADSAMELRPRMRLDQRGAFFIQRFARQVRCCYPAIRAHDPNDGTPAKYPPLFRGREVVFREPLLEFVTTAGAREPAVQLGRLTAVAYRLDDSGGTLLIRESIYGRIDEEREKDWHVVLEGISDFRIEYFDGEDWEDRWNAEVLGGPPRAVRVGFILASESRYAASFTAVAPVLCRQPVKADQRDGRPRDNEGMGL